jgi:hypothetical protein
MKKLDFAIPFSGSTTTDFINCFTCVYMHLEDIDLGGIDYDCAKMRGKGCNSCGNCGKGGDTPISRQEKLFFLFDTMCGRSSLRLRFDGEPTEMQKWIGETEDGGCGTDDTVEFLFGFAGYAYEKITGDFKAAIAASIDAGKPVIARVKAGPGRFRVIIGYDKDKLLEPDYKGAQKAPKKAVKYDELEALYIAGDKIQPRYLVEDGLKRIVKIMEYNAREKLWGGYTERIGLYPGDHITDSFGKVDLKEKQARMKRVADTMWHTFNCHNFAEVFRYFRDCRASMYDGIGDMKRLSDPALKDLWNAIGGSCNGYTHDLAWALIGLEKDADWKWHGAGYFGEMAELTLSRIKKNDEKALDCVKQMLAILRQGE